MTAKRHIFSPRAFTLIELLVAVSILVVVILAVGAVFRSTGRAIRVSNATIEADANVRTVMRQIANDVARIDRDGFLVIRSNYGLSPKRSQISFLAHGGFDNRTGAFNAPANSAAGNVRAHAAHVWYGFALTPEDMSSYPNRDATIAQDAPVQLNNISTAGTDSNAPTNMAVLGRHVFLLLPSNAGNTPNIVDADGIAVPAHPNFARNAPAIDVGGGESLASPSSGRTSVAALTPAQVMAQLRYEKYQPISTPAFLAHGNNNFIGSYGGAGAPVNRPGWNSYFDRSGYVDGGLTAPIPLPYPQSGNRLVLPYEGADYWYEARYNCYPFKVLRTPLAGTSADATRNVVNGVMRLSPTLLKWADEFVVDWTDGTTNSDGNLRWYGDPSGLQRNPSNNTVNMTCTDWFSSTLVWPPLDYYVMSYWSGGSNDWNNSAYPPLTDKAGELRSTGTIYQAPGSAYDVYTGRSNAVITRDVYTANFSFDNRARWPKALRVRIRIDMPQTEIANFASTFSRPRRTYSQTIWLPQ